MESDRRSHTSRLGDVSQGSLCEGGRLQSSLLLRPGLGPVVSPGGARHVRDGREVPVFRGVSPLAPSVLRAAINKPHTLGFRTRLSTFGFPATPMSRSCRMLSDFFL